MRKTRGRRVRTGVLRRLPSPYYHNRHYYYGVVITEVPNLWTRQLEETKMYAVITEHSIRSMNSREVASW